MALARRASVEVRECIGIEDEGRVKHTVVGIGTTHHQGHGVPARRRPQLAALDEVVDGPVDLYTVRVNEIFSSCSTTLPYYHATTLPLRQLKKQKKKVCKVGHTVKLGGKGGHFLALRDGTGA